MARTPLRFGILGAAAIAPAAIVAPCKSDPDAEVVAIAARQLGRAKSFASKHDIGKVHPTYEALLADDEVDAVYIPLPNGLHGAWTVRSLEAGKHVLCEKPFTANATEAKEVAEFASTTDRVVMEAFHWRYHPMAARILEIVRSGEVGEIRHIEAALCFPLLKPHDIRWQLDLAGGAAMDAGCYPINMVRTVAGSEPTVERAEVKMTKGGVDRFARAELRFPGGATGSVLASMLSTHVLALHLRVRGSAGQVKAFNPLMPKMGGSITVRTHTNRRRERHWPQSTYSCQLHAFVEAVRNGVQFPSTAQDAVANMAVIDALYRSAGVQPREPTPVR
ncbi:MAG TPA: Gfo/Idh/MocA family oxidoreductase [Acidimicrobiales bacterium]|nr:Gfo/Idh/MocA family oxidoreductase [Acidimicrobiales bacterium]